MICQLILRASYPITPRNQRFVQKGQLTQPLFSQAGNKSGIDLNHCFMFLAQSGLMTKYTHGRERRHSRKHDTSEYNLMDYSHIYSKQCTITKVSGISHPLFFRYIAKQVNSERIHSLHERKEKIFTHLFLSSPLLISSLCPLTSVWTVASDHSQDM